MVALVNSSIVVRFAPLDNFSHVAVYLEHPLLAVPPVLHGAHPHVLQGDDALGHILGRVLEVVETTVVQDEPATLPALPAAALMEKQ